MSSRQRAFDKDYGLPVNLWTACKVNGGRIAS